MTKTSNVFKFSNFQFSQANTVYRNFYVSKSRLPCKVSDSSWCLFGFCFNVFMFYYSKSNSYIWKEKKNQLLSCSIYCNLKLLFVHFWKKGVTIKKKIILCIFFNNTQKVITMSTACNSTKTWIFSQVFLKDFAYFLGTPI